VGRAGKSQATEDLWHLSISDLLATPKEPASLAGSGPVVINLSTSTAHIARPPKSMRRFEGLHLYLLRRGTEDEPQYLLRLGVIETEIEADAILSSVLEHYPGATKASPEEDDRVAMARRARSARRPKPAPASIPAPELPAKPAAKLPEAPRPAPKAAPAEPVAAPKPPEPVRWDIDEMLPDLAVTRPSWPKPHAPRAPSAPEPAAAPLQQGVIEIESNYDADAVTYEVPLPTFEFDAPEPAATAEVTFAREEVPAIEIEAIAHEDTPTVEVQVAPPEPPTIEVRTAPEEPLTIEVTAAYEELPTIEVRTAYEEPPTIEVQAADVFTVELQAPVIADEVHVADSLALEPAPDPKAETLEQLVAKIDAMVESVDQHDPPAPAPSNVPRIETTQTLRALTALELADDESSPWFSIQLAFSEQQIDPEQIPDLDLFSEYRLYSVMGLHESRTMHALRLGFFSSELAAEAVAGYLRGFFDNPCIERVSVAERERFAEKSITPGKDVGATGVHAVIELTSPKALPARQAQVSRKSTSEARSSIWSRLVAPLKRGA
jgi:hypothetical protein